MPFRVALTKDSEKLVKNIVVLFVLSAIIFLTRFHFVTLPLDRDEGTYSYIAWRMSEGELPYKDAFDHKPPVLYFLYKAAFDAFGYDFVSIRFFTILWLPVNPKQVIASFFKLFMLCSF